jgi:hypothetical protein
MSLRGTFVTISASPTHHAPCLLSTAWRNNADRRITHCYCLSNKHVVTGLPTETQYKNNFPHAELTYRTWEDGLCVGNEIYSDIFHPWWRDRDGESPGSVCYIIAVGSLCLPFSGGDSCTLNTELVCAWENSWTTACLFVFMFVCLFVNGFQSFRHSTSLERPSVVILTKMWERERDR